LSCKSQAHFFQAPLLNVPRSKYLNFNIGSCFYLRLEGIDFFIIGQLVPPKQVELIIISPEALKNQPV